MAPCLGYVERILLILLCLLLGHNLEIHFPTRKVAPLYGAEQITLMTLAVFCYNGCRLFVGQVLYTLLGEKMELDPHAFALRINQTIGMGTEAVHVSVGCRDATVGHDDGDLVKSLRQHSPEVPVVLRRTHIGVRIALHRMIEVRKLQRVANEEHRGVIAHKVPIALVGVELNGETADVAFGIGCPTFACNGRETHKDVGLLANMGEDTGTGISGYIMSDGEMAKSATPLCVHTTFGYDFAVEVGEFLHQPHIFHQERAAPPCRNGIGIVMDWSTDFVSQHLLVFTLMFVGCRAVRHLATTVLFVLIIHSTSV